MLKQTKLKLALAVIGAFLACATSSANAGVIFSQNFESGLSVNESVSGSLSIHNNSAIGNGTNMLGTQDYYGNNLTAIYGINLNLSGLTGALLSFDFATMTEEHFDGFAVFGNNQLLYSSNYGYDNNSDHSHGIAGNNSYTGSWNVANVLFNLSQFDGNSSLDLQFRISSDDSVVGNGGIQLDNVVITVPEPTSIALLGMGLLGFAASRRKKSA